MFICWGCVARVVLGKNTIVCGGISVYKISADGLPILERMRGRGLLGTTGRKGVATHSRLVGNGLQLILDIVRQFAGEKRGLSSLFRINYVKLVGSVSGFSVGRGIHFSACTMPVVVNRVHECLESGGSVHIDHSVGSATCGTVRTGRGLAATSNGRPHIRRVTERLRLPVRSIMVTLRDIMDPVSLCSPICSSNNSAVCILSRINSGGSSEG